MAPKTSRYKNVRCIICASEEPSQKITRDNNFEKLMKFFWDGLSLDVKPLDSLKYELCEVCFLKVVEFYDTNEVLSKLEKHLRTLQKTLIRNAIHGVEKLKTHRQPLLPVHKSLFEKWGNGFKQEEDEDDDNSNQAVENEESSVYSFLEPKEKVLKNHESENENESPKKLQPHRLCNELPIMESIVDDEEITISDSSSVEDDKCNSYPLS